MSIYRRFAADGQPSFITTNTNKRRRVFASARSCQCLVDVIYGVREQEHLQLLAFAIMPDHLHVIFVPESGAPRRVMQLMKGRFARLYNQSAGRTGQLWQSRYHERTLWTEAALSRAIDYVHHNPIVAGLVSTPEQYPWSSAHERHRTDLEEYLGSG